MANPKRYELTAQQWQRIEALLPGKAGDPGRTGADNLCFVNGVLWVLRSGAHWHDLPERYDERFRRMWNFYLLVSAGGFRSRYLGRFLLRQ